MLTFCMQLLPKATWCGRGIPACDGSPLVWASSAVDGTERVQFRAALKVADAMAPRALLADAIEKSLAGLRQARLRRRKREAP